MSINNNQLIIKIYNILQKNKRERNKIYKKIKKFEKTIQKLKFEINYLKGYISYFKQQ